MPEPAIISFLSDYGFYEVFLPFILVFAITYGILQKTHILGRDKKRFNIMVSLAISLIAIGSLQFSGILKEFTAKLGFGIIILLGLALVLGFFGVPLNSKFTIAIGIMAFITIVYLQFSNDAVNNALSSLLTNSMVIGIIIIGLIIYLLVRSPKKEKQPGEQPAKKPLAIPGVPKGNLEEQARLKKGTPEFEELYKKEGSRIQEILEKLKKE